MNREQIQKLIPHRDPMLMVDEVVEIEPGKRALARKYVRDDEFWCVGHFPGEPILPGVLMSEALAQTAGIVFASAHTDRAGGNVYLVGMDKMRFRQMVRPGDVLELEVEVIEERHHMWTFSGTARVGGKRAATGTFMATVDRE
ncbi:MAG: 3-hydroxyacyl-ACP dehydratase FabZ [Alphaproteobacteria bacterium]|nr:3-hydroxyacyl-ACP dehydratase FabZ [Alphaproteobacteria bacterium]